MTILIMIFLGSIAFITCWLNERIEKNFFEEEKEEDIERKRFM